MSCPCEKNNNEIVFSSNNVTPCTYTSEQILEWKNLIFCYKELYYDEDKKNINIALGIILSAIKVNPCLLKNELDSIKSLMLKIIDLNIC